MAASNVCERVLSTLSRRPICNEQRLLCSVRSHLNLAVEVPQSDRDRPPGAVPLPEELQLKSL